VHALRRRIGYVIQQVGLFPHMTVESNVAIVPRLLGWSAARVEARVDEMLNLVALEPGEYRARLPRELSGGQQQRVGVARALAGDPDVLLMDEPFGALDSVARTKLQDELVQLGAQLAKTILFVTHDVDEALRLGDRIVVMRDGSVVQVDTPGDLLRAPRDEFVTALTGADDLVRRLGQIPVVAAMRAAPETEIGASGREIESTSTLRAALTEMLASGEDALTVAEAGRPVGRLTMQDIRETARHL
jgi:osmoprotectant transport system ATP-binding protein